VIDPADEDEGPLYVPIDATIDDLIDAGCTPGSYYLHAVDAKKKPLRLRRAVVDIAPPPPPTAALEPERPKKVEPPSPPSPLPDEAAHLGYTRIIEAMARHTTELFTRLAEQQARFVETNSRLCSLVESLALRTPQSGVRETLQTVQAIRNAAPELAPPVAVQAPPETAPEKVILDGLGSVVTGLFRSPAAQVAMAKKMGFTAEEMRLMNEMAKHQAQGAAMPFGFPPNGAPPSPNGAAAPSSSNGAASPPPWPPELDPVLAQLTAEERAEAIEHLSHPQMTTAHVEQICAELRKCATLADKVALTRAFLVYARRMAGR
jgi:hypothetical protein